MSCERVTSFTHFWYYGLMYETGLSGGERHSDLVLVRPARLFDLPAITGIAYASVAEMTPGPAYTDHAAANRERIGSSKQYRRRGALIQESIDSPELQRVMVATLGSIAAMAETSHSVIGYLFARKVGPEDYLKSEHILVNGAAVDKDNRLMGVGRKLLSPVCEWAQEMALPVCAHVADTNTPMLHMLKDSGFTQDGTYSPGAGNPVTYQIMIRPVNDIILI